MANWLVWAGPEPRTMIGVLYTLATWSGEVNLLLLLLIQRTRNDGELVAMGGTQTKNRDCSAAHFRDMEQ